MAKRTSMEEFIALVRAYVAEHLPGDRAVSIEIWLTGDKRKHPSICHPVPRDPATPAQPPPSGPG